MKTIGFKSISLSQNLTESVLNCEALQSMPTLPCLTISRPLMLDIMGWSPLDNTISHKSVLIDNEGAGKSSLLMRCRGHFQQNEKTLVDACGGRGFLFHFLLDLFFVASYA